jgi:hypothetical protein
MNKGPQMRAPFHFYPAGDASIAAAMFDQR